MALTPKQPRTDVQFGRSYDQEKLNRLVDDLQRSQQNIATLLEQVAALQGAGGTTTVPSHELAGETGLGTAHTVSGLVAGQVLRANSPDSANFQQLALADLADVDPTSFGAPSSGDLVQFIDGYWVAAPNDGGLGIGPPGADAVLMYDVAAHGFAWALPGLAFKITAGQAAVDPTAIVHGELEDLLANDHPQYGRIAAANLWTQAQTLEGGFAAGADSSVAGDFSQAAAEPQALLENTDDITNEGWWARQANPGQLADSALNDDGSVGEAWVTVSRSGELVQQINLQGDELTFNGDDVVTGAANLNGAGGTGQVFVGRSGSTLLFAGLIPGNNLSITPESTGLRLDASGGGATGAQGPPGPAVFFSAEDGEDGWDAVPGRDGANGVTGAQGPPGPAIFLSAEDGEDGADGPPGIAGVAGAPGPAGSQGVLLLFEGEPGDDGAPGPAGSPGPSGRPGATGATGAAGPAGAPGAQGVLLLFEGEPGEDGSPGPPGANGSGGGGGTTYEIYAPATAHGTLPPMPSTQGWTLSHASTDAYVWTVASDGSWLLSAPSPSQWGFIWRADPGGNLDVRVFVVPGTTSGAFAFLVRNAANGEMMSLGPVTPNIDAMYLTGAAGAGAFNGATWSSTPESVGVPSSYSVNVSPYWWRFTRVGTTWSLMASVDGVIWDTLYSFAETFVLTYSEIGIAALNGAGSTGGVRFLGLSGLGVPVPSYVNIAAPVDAAAAAILASSPAAFWKCDDASGGFEDYSGNGYNLTTISGTVDFNNGGIVRTRPGALFARIGTIAGANGVGATTQLGLTFPLLNWSAEGIIATTSNVGSSGMRILDMRPSGSSAPAIIVFYSIGTGFECWYPGTSNILTVPFIAQAGTPFHFAVTVSTAGGTSTITFYVNGSPIGSVTAAQSTVSGTQAVNIGGFGPDNSDPFLVANVAIFGRALTAAEVSAHANAGFGSPSLIGNSVPNCAFTVNALPAATNLTTEGTLDWHMWGNLLYLEAQNPNNVYRKAQGIAALRRLFTDQLAGPTASFNASAYWTASWSAGDAQHTSAAGTNTTGTNVSASIGTGMKLVVDAERRTRYLRLYLSCGTTYRVICTMSDGTQFMQTGIATGNAQVVVAYNSATDGAEMSVQIHAEAAVNIGFLAATLAYS